MGFTPQQVGQMTLWQFLAVASGFQTDTEEAAPGGGTPMSQEEHDALGRQMGLVGFD